MEDIAFAAGRPSAASEVLYLGIRAGCPGAHPKALHLGIPQHRLGATGRRQIVNRTFGDLSPHTSPLATLVLWVLPGITKNRICDGVCRILAAESQAILRFR